MDIKQALQLYFIMGSQNTSADPVTVLKEAIEGGITCFQYREKGAGSKTGIQREQLGRKLRDICKVYGIPFIVNDDIELGLMLDADGFHIGQDDLPVQEVKKQIPSHMIVGVSTSTIEESVQAEKDGADYIGVGPIYSTESKADAIDPIHLRGLQNIREAVPTFPIVAISGINETNARKIIHAGADGISLISAISQADDVVTTTKQLLKQVK